MFTNAKKIAQYFFNPPWGRTFIFKWQGLLWVLRTSGLRHAAKLVMAKALAQLKLGTQQDKHKHCLKIIFDNHPTKPIIIFPPIIDWNIPLFQRPQHLALKLAGEGFLYFFCTRNGFDSINGFTEVAPNCYITNQFDLLLHVNAKKIFHVYAQDEQITISFLEKAIDEQHTILYEYVDEIHEDISGRTTPHHLLDRHAWALRNEHILCVATADKLYRHVASHRTANMSLVTNGVDVDHFAVPRELITAPVILRPLLEKNRPIIGYFGALAKWFDYELIKQLAVNRPEYEILLIGWNYDKSLDDSQLQCSDNITVLGPVNYIDLPRYAIWFDVAMIPFLVNDVTESTSPIKLFEYMALGHPIVSTDLPECNKYKSVLIAKNNIDFITKVDDARSLRHDPNYQALLRTEAEANSWGKKAADIARLLTAA